VKPWTVSGRWNFADGRGDERVLLRDAILGMAGAGKAEDVARIL
jgi:hypothetical protein